MRQWLVQWFIGEIIKVKFYNVFIEHGAVVDVSNLIGEKIGMDRKKNEFDLFSKQKERCH